MAKKSKIGSIWFVLFPLVSSLCRFDYLPILEEAFGVKFTPRENARGSEKLGLRYDCLHKLAEIASQDPRGFVMKIEEIAPALKQRNAVAFEKVMEHLKPLLYWLYYGGLEGLQRIPQFSEVLTQLTGGKKRGMYAKIPQAIRILASRGVLPPLEEVRRAVIEGSALEMPPAPVTVPETVNV